MQLIDSLAESEYLLLEIMSNISRIIPYNFDNKTHKSFISNKDGLMEFA